MLSTIYERILLTITAVSVITQCYVIWLVQKKSPQSMRKYRFFLNTFTIFDMLFTITLGFLLEPYPIAPIFGCSVRGISAYGNHFLVKLTVSTAISIGANVIIAQDYCLIYRCILICGSKKIHDLYVTWQSKLFWFLFHQLIAVSLKLIGNLKGLGMFFTFMSDKEAHELLKQKGISEENARPDDPIVVVDFFHSYTLKYLATLVFSIAFSELLCISLIYKIIVTLRKNIAAFSKTTYRLHLELILLLSVQLATPLVLILLPLVLVLLIKYIGFHSTDLFTKVGLTMLTLYAPVNSSLTIFFIGPYRRHAYETFVKWWFEGSNFTRTLQHSLLNKRNPSVHPSLQSLQPQQQSIVGPT